MLRRSQVSLNYRATYELERIRSMMRGRARLERKIGLKYLFFLMRTQTRYRVELQSYWERSIVRKNVDSAAREHGSGWPYLRNDLARQNVLLLPRTQQALAQYEPIAFRAVVELCASRIPPPPPPVTAQVPEEAYSSHVVQPTVSHPAAQKELRDGIERMLRAGKSSALAEAGPKTVNEWADAWKEYDVGVSSSSSQR